jgi:sugar phosphate isomerase/epimerase
MNNAIAARQQFRLGSTLFSFTNEYLNLEYSFEQLIARVAQLELGPGLEIIGFSHIRGFPAVSDHFAGRFRELMAQHGLTPSCLSINADVAIRRGTLMSNEQAAAYFEPQLRAAAKLGFPVVRTQLGAAPEVLERLLPLAERLQVKMGPEVHAPFTVDAPVVLAYREMYQRLKSPFLGFIPDFGASAKALPPSYLEYLRQGGIPPDLLQLAVGIWGGPGDAQWKREEFNRQAAAQQADPAAISGLSVLFSILSPQDPRAWLAIMPQVIHVHAKFYEFDAAGSELTIPYDQLLPVFVEGGYRGFMSSEWEGHMYSKGSGFEAVQKHHAMCRRILARYQ